MSLTRRSFQLLFTAALLGLAAISSQAAETVLVPRADGAQVPLRVYAASSKDCAPLALLSPGAGGDENGLAYLAQGLQIQGWTAIVLGHRESGPNILRRDIARAGIRGGLEELTTDTGAYKARLMDIAAALAWSDRKCQAPIRVLLGHSMGAATVMLEAGARNNLGVQGKDRFQAYVALSPQGPGSIFPEQAWSGIRKPVFVITGTRDRALEGNWQTREIPFYQMPAGCKWLGVVDGASHMQLGGGDPSGQVQGSVIKVVAAFLSGIRNNSCISPADSPIPLQTK